MTKISYIAGIQDTPKGTGKVPAPTYIDYLSQTKGEMSLSLMLEQAKILSDFYGQPKYKEAATMLENALYRGIHGSSPYLGAYSAPLHGVARAIAAASRENKPASGDALLGRKNALKGIHGNNIIPVDERLKACIEAIKGKYPTPQGQIVALAECQRKFKIEKILNDGLEKCGQYMAYGFLPSKGVNGLPQSAYSKLRDQLIAMQDIARVGKFDTSLLGQWLNVGMMRQNAVSQGVDHPFGWIDTNAILTTVPLAGENEIIALFSGSKDKWTAGVTSETALGQKFTQIVKKYKQPAVGQIEVAIAIIGAITALIGKVTAFAKALKNEQTDAFSQVNGFGTRALGPEEGDYTYEPAPDVLPGKPDNTLLLLGAGAVAAYALTR